jgi:hypothetical protein
MHQVQRAAEVELVVPERYEAHARGFSQAALVGRDARAVHTGFALNRLAGGGHIDVHLPRSRRASTSSPVIRSCRWRDACTGSHPATAA